MMNLTKKETLCREVASYNIKAGVTALTFPQGLTPGVYISKMMDDNKRITVLQLTYRP